ncbi:protein jag [Humidisolicoccus flavus]|uniref:Jag family protein n=1 Tax=Humidisolicoccus flavus TaxID=3111414 RepID=UPI0032465737
MTNAEQDLAVEENEVVEKNDAVTDDTASESEESLDGDAVDPSDEGEIAADYIEELLDICDLDGDIEIERRGARVLLTVGTADDESLQNLSNKDAVAALQDLTRLAVQARTGEFSRLVLDVAGSRDARAKELEDLVDAAAEAIEGGAAEFSMPPMSSYERKVVHDLVSERGLESESQGEGSARHSVIRSA